MQKYIEETHEYYEEIDIQYERALSWSIEAVVGKLNQSRGTKLEQIEFKDINKLNKPDIALLLLDSFEQLAKMMKCVKGLRLDTSVAQKSLIESQKQVISVQELLSCCKTELLGTLSTPLNRLSLTLSSQNSRLTVRLCRKISLRSKSSARRRCRQ